MTELHFDFTAQCVCQGCNTVTRKFGARAVGERVTVIVKVNRADKNNPIENAATLTASTFDIRLGNNSATATAQ